MGLGNFFSKINAKLQEKYQGLSDFLTEKGIPLQRYNNFLEGHGIPAMWFSIFLILLIIIVIVLISLLIFKSSIVLQVNFEDMGKNKLDNVLLTIGFGEDQLYNELTTDGQSITLNGVSDGDSLKVIGQLEGYTFVGPLEIIVSGKKMYKIITFTKEEKIGSMQLRLVDKEFQTIIPGADVNVYSDGELLFSTKSDDSGIVLLSGISLQGPLTIKINKDGYLDFQTIEVPANGKITDLILEPKSIATGEKGTITFTVTSANGLPLEKVKVQLYSSDKKLIAEDYTDAQGKLPINIQKGIELRYVVSKEDFITFDSQDKNKNITLRQNSLGINVYLDLGGTKISVIVRDETKQNVPGATVALYSENGLIIDTKTTDFLGVVEFSGIDVKRGAYVSAYALGNFYPVTQYVDSETLPPIILILKKINFSTAAKINIFAANVDNKPIANASVDISIIGEKNLPVYLPDNRTAITGLFTTILEPNNNIQVTISTEDLEGTQDALLVSGDNKIEITLTTKQKTSKLYIYGPNGQPLKNGGLTIKTETSVLFDGNTGLGKVEFLSNGAKEVEVTVVDGKGNIYTKLVDVSEKMEILLTELDITKDPKISFVGIYDAYANKVNGVKIGGTYYLKFSLIWPKGQTKGEAHVRLGKENEPVKSMQYAILGVDSIGTKKEYGLYYTENTDESFVKDLQVFGRSGIRNKWANIIYENPKGFTEFKVKVNVSNALDLNKLYVYYRADSFDGNSYHTDPKSDVSVQNSKLKKLHSNTYSEEIEVFSSLFECSSVSSVCYSYSFTDGFTKYSEFSAVVDEFYAIDFDFYSPSDASTRLDFNANNLLKTIVLNGLDEDLMNFNPKETELESLSYSLVLKKGEHKKFRLYFNAKQQGTATISMTAPIIGLQKNFDFRIDGQRTLNVNLNGNGYIEFGKPIIFNVSDTQGKISNAIITVTEDKGLATVLVKGDNTQQKGKDGTYVISELPSGVYNYEVRAQQHVTVRGNFIVTRFGVLSIKSEHEIKIPPGKKQRDYEIVVSNISQYPVLKLSSDVLRDDAKAFVVSYRFVKSNLLPQSDTKLIVTVSTETDQIIYGDQDLVISGTINGNEIVRQVIHLSFIANSELDSSCLVADPTELNATLYDTQAKRFEGILNLRNECEFDFVQLSPFLVFRDFNEIAQSVDFSASAISLKRGEQKPLRFSLTSRGVVQGQSIKAELFLNLDTGYFIKQLPLHLNLIHSFGQLYISVPNPQLFLSADQIVTMPLFINNLGSVPLRNVTVMLLPYNASPFTTGVPYSDVPASEYYNPLLNGPQTQSLYDPWGNYKSSLSPYNNWTPQGVAQASQTNVRVNISPNPRVLPYIMPNQTGLSQLYIQPPYTQKANVITAYTILVRGVSSVDSQPVEASIPLFLSISSPKCVKAVIPGSELSFISGKLEVYLPPNDNLTIQNDCAEPIKLDLPISQNIKDKVSLEVTAENAENAGNQQILPKQALTLKSVVFAGSELSWTQPIIFKAIGLQTNKIYELAVNYRFEFGRTAKGKDILPTLDKEMSVCDSDTKVSVKFPKVASSVDCGAAYCDGQTASDYLQGKIKGYLELYNNAGAKYTKDLKSTGCKPEAKSCSFEKLGIEYTPFTLYLMHDRISEEYLEKVLNASIPQIKSVNLLPLQGFNLVEQSEYQFNKLFVDMSIAKCGKYTITLEGAFAIRDGSMQKDSFSLLARAGYENTPECKPEIQNAILFLPKDSKSGIDNTAGFLLGYADYDKSLVGVGYDLLAKEASKKFFAQERLAQGKSNTLFFTRASLENRVLDISLKAEENPQVVVTVNKEIDVSKPDKRQDVLNSVEAALKGGFIGCITKEEDKLHFVSSTSDLKGAYKLSISKKDVLAGSGKQSVKFSLIGPVGGGGKLFVLPDNPQGYTTRIINQQNNEVSDISIFKGGPQEYILEIDFSDPSVAQNFNKADPLKLVFRPVVGDDLVESISFRPCGVPPADFIFGVLGSGLKNNQYFAQVYWEGGEIQKDGCEVLKEVQEKNKNIYISGKTPNTTCSSNNVKPFASDITSGLPLAIGAASVAGFGACMATEMVVGKAKFLGPFAWAGAALQCSIITVDLGLTSWYANHRNNVALGIDSGDHWYDGVHNWFAKIPVVGALFNDYDKESQPGVTDEQKAKELFENKGALTGRDVRQEVEDAFILSLFNTSRLNTITGMQEEMASAMQRFEISSHAELQANLPKAKGDYGKFFKWLASKDPQFATSYSKFESLLTSTNKTLLGKSKPRITEEKLFEIGMKKAQKDAMTGMVQSANNEAAVQEQIAKAKQELGTMEKAKVDLLAKETEYDKALKDLVAKGKEVKAQDVAKAKADLKLVQDNISKTNSQTKIKTAEVDTLIKDVGEFDTRISEVQKKVTTAQKELDTLGKQAKAIGIDEANLKSLVKADAKVTELDSLYSTTEKELRDYKALKEVEPAVKQQYDALGQHAGGLAHELQSSSTTATRRTEINKLLGEIEVQRKAIVKDLEVKLQDYETKVKKYELKLSKIDEQTKLLEKVAQKHFDIKNATQEIDDLTKAKTIKTTEIATPKAQLESEIGTLQNQRVDFLKQQADAEKILKDLKAKKITSGLEYDTAVKNLSDAKTKLVQLEKDITRLQAQAKSPITQVGEQLGAPESRAGRFWKSTKNFGKGLLKGAISAGAAIVAYNLAWKTTMNSSLGSGVKSIDIALPDFFVKQNAYVFNVTPNGAGEYKGIIKETSASNLIGFCSEENLKKCYIAKGTLGAGTGSIGPGVTGADGQCISYANLFAKYGEVLKTKTAGAMDGKNIITQAHNESGFKTNIDNKRSDSSATGLGQFMQGTFCKITLDISAGKYSDYLAVFDMSQLEKFGVASFGELYSKACNGKTQSSGGLLIGANPKGPIDYSKDPRANPEIAIMYMAILLGNIYKNKHSVRMTTESYVVGEGCVIGEGNYSDSITCSKNYPGNPGIKPGSYWTNYQSYIAGAAGVCLASAGSAIAENTSSTTTSASALCNPSIRIALVGDSITAKYSSYLSKILENCGKIVSKSSASAYNQSSCPSDSLACVSAPTSWMLSQLQKKYTAGEKYDLVIVLGGTNDLGTAGTNIKSVKRNLLQIYSLAKTNGAKVVAVTVVPREANKEGVDNLNTWIKSLGSSQNVDIVVDTTQEIIIANKNVLPKDPHGFSKVIATDVYNTVFVS